VFRAHADARGMMSFARFMEVALYDPAVGYYRQPRRRIGYGADTDFYTASTSGPIFGELVAEACASLLRAGGIDPRDATFVEIGVEAIAGAGVLAGVAHPFGAAKNVSIGESPALSGTCVVFSNELFDAQPFRRFRFHSGTWRELGVALAGESLIEVELTDSSLDFDELPVASVEGYTIDLPFAARDLARQIAAQSWRGLLVACDYGKSWRELIEAAPAGTARAYFRHTQSNDLLARPGEQDLTCHVCWDWLEDALASHGFRGLQVESQEAFFIHHARDFIARTSESEAAKLSRRKLALMQLLHPAHLGQKFQVLHGLR
jgi:SAM-dependent MidA family methyltransferase